MKTANLAIVFTDIKGFTERTSAQTLEQNQRLLATHDALLTPLFKAFGGRIIKSIGDAFLVTFESPTSAVLSGVAIQDRLWQYNQRIDPKERLDVRVAINVGEVRVEAGDVFGEPVNIAARVEGIAEAGEVFFTEAVHLSMNKAEVPGVEVGEFELKGIPGKIRVYKVPKAPYRVEPAAAGGVDAGAAAPPTAGVPAEQPPFGNLALNKVTDESLRSGRLDPAVLQERAAHFATAAASLAGRAVSGGGQLLQQGVRGLEARGLPRGKVLGAAGAAVLLIALVFAVATSKSEAEKLVEAVAAAPQAERWSKAEAARKVIEKEKDAGQRAFLQGQLAEALGQGGFSFYVAAVKAGSGKAERRLLDLLGSPRCSARSGAAEALGELKLARAKGKLESLAENGGPDDGEQVLIFGCNSKNAAAAALKRFDGSE